MKKLAFGSSILTFLLFQVSVCHAQTVLNGEQGLVPYGSYHAGDVDAIDLKSGNLVLRIPLFSLPQMGKLSLSFSLVMNNQKFGQSQFCDLDYYPDPNNPVSACYNQYIQTGPVGPQLVMDQALTVNVTPYPSPLDYDDFSCTPNCPGWNIALPRVSLNDSTGASHEMLYDSANWSLLHASDGSGYSWQTAYTPASFQPGILQVYTGAPWQTLYPNDPNTPHGTLAGTFMLPDGTTLAPGATDTTITDRMNNTITYSTWPGQPAGWYGLYSGSNSVGSYPGAVVDSVGRSIPDFFLAPYNSPVSASCPNLGLSNQPVASSKTWPVPGPNGGNTVYVFCYTTVTYNTNFNGGNVRGMLTTQDGTAYYPEAIGEQVALQSVVLPNGTYWGFSYDSAGPLVVQSDFPGPDPAASPVAYADLTQLRYPTGASVSYQYFTGADRISNVRTLNDGAGKTYSWQYAYSQSNQASSGVGAVAGYATVTDPDLNDTVHTFTVVQAPPASFYNVQETKTQQFQGPQSQNNVSKTTIRQFSNVSSNYDNGNYIAVNQEPTSSVENLTGGQSTTSSYQYPQLVSLLRPECILNNDSVCGYWSTGDYGSGPLQVSYNEPRSVTVTLSDGSFSSQTTTSFQYMQNPAYLSANVIAPVSSVQTVDLTNPASVSDTTFGYDEPNGSPQGTFGNQTSIAKLVESGGSKISTSVVYNSHGMPVISIDPNGNSTVTTYDGSGLFPSQIQQPTTNGVPHVDYYSYDTNTGHVQWHTDQNGTQRGDPAHTTSYSYADPLGRLTKVLSPPTPLGRGETDILYNDASRTVTSTVIATPDPPRASVQVYDALGRAIGQTSTGSAAIHTAVALDWAGRVLTRWNPSTCDPLTVSSCPGESTWGATTYRYDALGRITMQCNQDNGTGAGPCSPQASYQSWVYNGNASLFTDEVNHSTLRTTDGLGRLTRVVEPGSLLTTYGYDVFGNVTNVIQAGNGTETPRQRSFKYDSLSRLLSANNPETGVVCYGHGNGTTAGCQADGYDADGNLLYKTDARGVLTSYKYDALNRLTLKTYSDGSRNAAYGYDGHGDIPNTPLLPQSTNAVGRLSHVSDDVAAASNLGYDSMGRLTYKADCLPSDCSYNVVTTANYDLAGNLTSLTYPDGRTVTSGYDSAGHIWNVGSGTNAQTYLQSTTYNPDGSPHQLMLGNGIIQTWTQDNRLQVGSLSLIDPILSKTYLSHSYCYSSADCPAGGPANNGNIWQITDLQNSARTQNFAYDNLNRIQSFSQPSFGSQQYSIDSFGNLSQVANGAAVTAFDPATNRIGNLPCAASTAPYDAAGNQLCNTDPYGAVSQYVYDGESRIQSIYTLNNVNPFVVYTYGADGARARKQTADGSSTEYVSFNGLTVAEKDQNGNWTDYIFANGTRIAEVPQEENVLQVTGSYSGGWTGVGTTLNPPQMQNYTFRPGDVLNVRQRKFGANDHGGILLYGNGIGSFFYDQDGQRADDDALGAGVWHNRQIPLDGLAGTVYSGTAIGGGTSADYTFQFASISVSSADGSVRSIYNGGISGPSIQVAADNTATRFYGADHLGSAQMTFNSVGMPLSSTQFSPFGAELSLATPSPDHYKFTGKERDTESGLDYFGARYYGSSMGRFMSPDPSGLAYANLANPQSFNLYSYVRNNPLVNIDPTGLKCQYSDDGTPSDDGDGTGCVDAGINPDESETTPSVQATVTTNIDPIDTTTLTSDDTCHSLAMTGSSGPAGAVRNGAANTMGALSAPINYVKSVGTAAMMTAQFATGLGPQDRVFGPGSIQSQQMVHSPGVTDAVTNYLTNGLTSGGYNFDNVGAVVSAGADPTQQFVGTYSYTIQQNGGTMTLFLYNETSVNSLLYHQTPGLNHSRSSLGVGGTTAQLYQVNISCP